LQTVPAGSLKGGQDRLHGEKIGTEFRFAGVSVDGSGVGTATKDVKARGLLKIVAG
jgi:hypothetical protein